MIIVNIVILAILIIFVGLFCVCFIGFKLLWKAANELELAFEKETKLYRLVRIWLSIKQENKSISKYFCDNAYKNIAIYGMGNIGKLLLEELRDSEVQVMYGIDQKELNNGIIRVVKPTDQLPEVDLIVVTATMYFNDIEYHLSQNTNIPIRSLESILLDVL